MGRTGVCWDNALAESFFATLKTELIYTKSWPTRAKTRLAITEWIEAHYNRRRMHSPASMTRVADSSTLHRCLAG